MKIAVIGGGAAGFFAAIHARTCGHEVVIFEKSSKLLSKVKVSGGGRCNVTHRPMEISKLVKNYPRGEKFLKRVFRKFKSEDTISWFESHGVPLKIEKDGRMFPVSDSSQTVIDALLQEANRLKIDLKLSCAVDAIQVLNPGFELKTSKGLYTCDKLIIATGGHPKLTGYGFLAGLNHQVVEPIPSLFTFNTPKESLKELMGLSVADGIVKLAGTKFTYQGPILVTHWGISGPAVLKLSAFGAKWLQESHYKATALIQWNAAFGEDDFRSNIKSFSLKHPNKKVLTNALFNIPGRLWEHFCQKAEIGTDEVFGTLSKKQLNKLVQNLFCYNLNVEGKTTFKEEFVTAGGISLEGVNPETMESKYHPNLYFAGEVLDIDGITGGFNFQAAWSTGYLAGISSPN